MSYKCLIVDDEQHARELIEHHIAQLPDFEVVATCESAIQATEYLRNGEIDLLFLDIEMPVLKGNELIRSLQNPPKVVFTTAHRDYAVQAFELDALDYLLKPITFSRFYQAIEKFRNSQPVLVTEENQITDSQEPKAKYILIKKDKKHLKICTEEILYIESLKDYITIHLTNGEHTIKQTLSSFYETLPEHFLRIHRSFVINTREITAFSKSSIEVNQKELPIGESFKEDALAFLEGLKE